MSAKTCPTRLVAVMGATGTGKSKFINILANAQFMVGTGLRSCTADVAESPPIETCHDQVVLVDTPGFDDTTISDEIILARIAAFLGTKYRQGQLLSGVVYMHRITDRKMGGSSHKNLNVFRKLCGDEALVNVAIVTNMWENVDPTLGAAREEELAKDDTMFGPLIAKGAHMHRHDGSRASALKILIQVLECTPRPLLLQRELVDEGKDIVDTSAAQEIDREVAAARRRFQKDLEDIRERLEEALREKDTESQLENEEEYEILKKKVEEAETTHMKLATAFVEAQVLAQNQRSGPQVGQTGELQTKKLLAQEDQGSDAAPQDIENINNAMTNPSTRLEGVETGLHEVKERIHVLEENVQKVTRNHRQICLRTKRAQLRESNVDSKVVAEGELPMEAHEIQIRPADWCYWKTGNMSLQGTPRVQIGEPINKPGHLHPSRRGARARHQEGETYCRLLATFLRYLSKEEAASSGIITLQSIPRPRSC
ncbi:unnamed protein product [Somion occarium]|uniref:G domain-containing protein n=1 Tax=Somion occarium TaxID=3059160 RepID=A0ABP1EB65_9APHY